MYAIDFGEFTYQDIIPHKQRDIPLVDVKQVKGKRILPPFYTNRLNREHL